MYKKNVFGRKLKFYLIALGLLCSVGGLGRNILENPSFEELDSSAPPNPLYWKPIKFNSLQNHHSVDSSLGSNGKNALKLENSNSAIGASSFILWQQTGLQTKLREACTAGSELEFSVNVKTSSPEVKVRIYFESKKDDGAGPFIQSPSISLSGGDWERVVLRFKMPDVELTEAYVCLQLLNQGEVLFDEAYLGVAADAPKLQNIKVQRLISQVAGGTTSISEKSTDKPQQSGEKPAPQKIRAENKIDNASFENLNDHKMPQGWSVMQKDIKGELHFIDTNISKNGSRSIKIVCNDENLNAKNYLLFMQNGLAPHLADCPPGTDMELSVWVNTGNNPSVKFRFYIEMMDKSKYVAGFVSPDESVYVGWERKTLKFKMPDTVADNVYVCLQLLSPGAVWFDDVFLGKAKESTAKNENPEIQFNKNKCRVLNFPPRQTYFIPDVPKDISLLWENVNAKDINLSVVLRDSNCKILKEYNNIKISSDNKSVIDLPQLPKGSYELVYKSGSDIIGDNLFRIQEPNDKGVRFTKDHRMYLDGKLFFPVMLFTPLMEEDALRVYGQAGFNSIVFPYLTYNIDTAKYLCETAASHGLTGTVALTGFGNVANTKNADFQKTVLQNIEVARKLPGFIGWLDDESEMRKVPLTWMQRNYQEFFHKAPEYVIWQNHAPRMTAEKGITGTFQNVVKYTHYCDVMGADIYPLPEEKNDHSNLKNKTMSCVGEYTDLCMASGYGEKPVWMILQAGDWDDIFNVKSRDNSKKKTKPTYEQFRFMCYNAITHGATGLVFYGTRGLADVYSPFMAMIADVLQEFKVIMPIFLNGEKMAVAISGETNDIRVMSYKYNDKQFFIIVNESKDARHIKLSSDCGKLYISPTGKECVGTKSFSQELLSFGFSSPQIFDLTLAGNEVMILSNWKIIVPKHDVFEKKRINHKTNGSLGHQNWEALWTAHPTISQKDDSYTFARHQFNLLQDPVKATIKIVGDDSWEMWVNGKLTGFGVGHRNAYQYDITKLLTKGANELKFKLYNITGPSGVLYECEINTKDNTEKIYSGELTEFSEDGKDKWGKALCLGKPPVAPWGEIPVLVIK